MMYDSSKEKRYEKYEDRVNYLINLLFDNKFSRVNRYKYLDGRNYPQTIEIDGEEYYLPDISVYSNKEMSVLELRIEVKGFYFLPKKESPNKDLALFPIKIRQIKEYLKLQSRDEIECRIVIVIQNGSDNYDEYTYYWSKIYDMANNMKFYRSNWDGEDALWYNVKDMNCNTNFCE